MNFAKMLLLLTLSTSVLAGCRSDDEEPRRSSGKTIIGTGTGTTGTTGVLLVDLTAASVTGTVNQPVELTAQGWLDSTKTTPVTAGTAITFARVNANGSLSDNSILADSLGQAKVTVTSSAPGSVTTTATIDSVDSNAVVVAFQAAAPGGGGGGGGGTTGSVSVIATSNKDVLTVYDDDILNAGDTAILTFTVLVDATPSAGTLVRLSASSGSLSSNILTTNASGIVTVGYTAGLLAEDAVITATSAGQTKTYQIIILPGVPASISVETPSPNILGLQGSGSPESSVVAFTVRDRYGNLVSDSNVVSLALTPVLTGATVTPASMTTNKGKISPVVHAGSQFGTMQLVATVGGVSVTSGNITIKNDAVSLVVDTLEVGLNKTSLTVFDGNSGNTGDQATVVVTVRDQNGAVMSGVPVKLSSTTGSFSSNLITTDITGTVTATYTAGSSASDAIITATAGGKTGIATITVLPGEPFFVEADLPSLTDLGFTGTGSPESSIVSFTVRDQYGNLVSDSTVVTLTLSPPVAGVTVSPSSMTTNQGRISTIVHSGSTAGAVRVIATVTAVGSPTALSNEIRISGGNVTTISVASSKPSVTVYDDSVGNTGDQASISVTVLNQYGAAMPGVSVALSASSGSLASNLLTTDGAGMVTVTYTAGTASGNVSISASTAGQSGAVTLSVIAGTPTSIEVAAPSPAVLGLQGTGSAESSVVRFTVRDQYGNLASNTTVVNLSLVPVLAGATVAPTSMVTNNGVISAVVHTGTAIGTMRVVATVAGGSVSVTSGGISVVGGVVTTTSVVSGSSFVDVYDGLPGGTDETNVNVTVLDEFGNPLPGVSVALDASAGLLSSELEITDGLGMISVTFSAGIVAQDVEITAVANGMTSVATIRVLPGDPFVVEMGSPTPSVLGLDGSGLPRNSVVAVSVKDQYGNLVADGAGVTFALSPVLAGSTVSPVSLTTNGGKVSPVVHAGTAGGNMRLVATVTGFGNPSAMSNNITIFEDIAEVTSLSVVSSKTTVTVFDEVALNLGDTATIVVTVLDQFGGPVAAGIPVSLSSTSGNLSETNLNTDAFGAVTVTYTAGTVAGAAQIRATAVGVEGTTTVTVLAGAPTVISAGAPSRTTLGLQGSGSPETSTLTFTARDRYGNLASDATLIDFVLVPVLAGATIAPNSMNTNNGVISPIVQSGTVTGTMRVVATVNGSTVSVTSGQISVTAGEVSDVSVVVLKPAVNVYDELSTNDQSSVVVTVLNQNGIAIVGVPVRLSVNAGNLSSDFELTDGAGRVTVTYTAGTVSGNAVITAVVEGESDFATLPVLPGAPAVITVGAPSVLELGLQSSGSPETSVLTFKVTDRYGNLASNATVVDFVLSPVLAGATVSPTSINTNAGIISPVVHSGTATGTMRVVATVNGSSVTVSSSEIRVTAGSVNSVSVLAVQPSVTVYDDVPANTGDQSSVVITVRNENGQVMPGVGVDILVSSGSLSSSYELTDLAGTVTVTYTAGTVSGDVTITAIADGVNDFATLPVLPGQPAVISVGAPSLTELGVTGSGSPETSVVTFTVTDQYGNMSTGGTVVNFVLVPVLAGATVSPTSMNINGGKISPVVHSGTATGTMRILATVSGSSVSVSSAGITIKGGVASSISIAADASVTVNDGIVGGTDESTVLVTVRDQYGNPLAGESVQLSTTAGNLSSELEITNALGEATVTFVAGMTAEDVVITAEAGELDSAATIRVLPGSPFVVEMGTPAPSVLGLDGSGLPRSSVVKVTVRDQYGNLVANDTVVSFSIIPALSSATVSPLSMTTFNGVISPVIHAGSVGENVQLVATVIGFGNPSAMSSGITIFEESVEVSSLTISSNKTTVTVFDEATLNTGDQATITVTVRNQFGGAVGAGVPVVLSASSGNLATTNLTTNGAGTVTTTYTAGIVAGVVEITAEAEGADGIIAIRVLPGVAFVIELGTPTPLELGLQGSGNPEISVIDVAVKDKFGNFVSDSTLVSYSLAPALPGASVSPATITTENGLSKAFVHTGTVSGGIRLIASVPGHSVISSEISVVGAPATQVASLAIAVNKTSIVVNDGNPSNTIDQAVFVVTVRDRDGVIMSGVPVALNASAGSLSESLLTTDGLGEVTVTYTAGIVAGIVTITASVESIVGSKSIVVGPGAPYIIEVGTPTPTQLGVKGSGAPESSIILISIKDQSGNPVSDSTSVTFRLEPKLGGASVSPVTATTHDGLISAVVNSGTQSGTIRLVATVAGNTVTSGKVTIFGGLPSANHIDFVVEAGRRVVPGFRHTGIESPMTLFLTDRYGNPVQPGTSVYVACEAGRCGNNDGTGLLTDDTGRVDIQVESAFANAVYQHPSWIGAVKQDFGGNVGLNHEYPNINDPRMGYVSLIAMATGEGAYFDANGNNEFDFGLDTVLLDPSEPYLDVNWNGSRDTFEDFWDFDLNGSFNDHLHALDAVTGPAYHNQQHIWASQTIIYSDFPNLQMVPQQYVDLEGDGKYTPGIDLAVLGGPAPANQIELKAKLFNYATAFTTMELRPGYTSYVSDSTIMSVSFSDMNNNPFPKASGMDFSVNTSKILHEKPNGSFRSYGADYFFAIAPVNSTLVEQDGDKGVDNMARAFSFCASIQVVGPLDQDVYTDCINGVQF